MSGWPRTLRGRVVAILLTAVLVAAAAGALLLRSERDGLAVMLSAEAAATRLAGAARSLDAAGGAVTPQLQEALRLADVRLLPTLPQTPQSSRAAEAFSAALRARLGAASAVHAAETDGALELAVAFGQPPVVLATHEPALLRLPPAPLPVLLLLLLALAAAGWLAARWATEPLSALAAAAASYGTAAETGPLPERGPLEVQQAARAFNEMRERIRRMVEEKTRMLAAISHDLRAPITRMRMRVEMLNDAADAQRLREDLDELRRLTDEALNYLRGDRDGEPVVLLDLAQLAAEVVREADEAGRPATLTDSASLPVHGRPGALRRALRNLVDNALTHGGDAQVIVTTEVEAAVVRVRDHGPGLPEAELEHVFEPFYRGDAARGHYRGFGLGLPIAREIARAHGGDVQLRRCADGGLEAELRVRAATGATTPRAP